MVKESRRGGGGAGRGRGRERGTVSDIQGVAATPIDGTARIVTDEGRGRGTVSQSDIERVAATPIYGSAVTDKDTGRDQRQMQFLLACMEGDIEHIKSLVALMDAGERASLASKRYEGFGPLHSAAGSGNIELCKYLVEQIGFDVNSDSTDLGSGMTPLFSATIGDHVTVAKYLLDNGADPNMKDSFDGDTCLHRAAMLGFDEMLEILLAKGANVDEISSSGAPLLVAAARGKLRCMQILLEHHADPNLVSPKLVSPLIVLLLRTPKYLSESTCVECLKLLVKAGADYKSSYRMTPLQIANSRGATRCAKYLLELEKLDGRKARLEPNSTKAGVLKDCTAVYEFCSEVKTSGNDFKSKVESTDNKAAMISKKQFQPVCPRLPKQRAYPKNCLEGWVQNRNNFMLEPVGRKIETLFRLPSEVFLDLYGYQRDGVKWLWTLYCKSRGGILADDMGLGKTKQVSSFLAGMFFSGLVHRILIIAPSIVLPGWDNELQEKVHINTNVKFYSSGDQEKENNLKLIVKEGGIILISYDMFRDHYDVLSGDGESDRWDYIIFDEGHTIKNYASKISKAAQKIVCKHKIIVSGTPIQNNLNEFYTLFKVCCPTILGDKKFFTKTYAKPIRDAQFKRASFNERCKSASAMKVLKNYTGAYILRRTKQELKEQNKLPKGLPNKTEFAVWLRLSPYQEMLYRELLTNKSIQQKLKGAPLVAITIMKKICQHPMLLETAILAEDLSNEENGLVQNVCKMLCKLCCPPDGSSNNHDHSCKITFLMHLMESFVENEQRVLIFSQSRSMLDLIQDALSLHFEDERVVRIDGTVKVSERTNIVKDFQFGTENPARIFLITSQVGGVGITLTKASRVVIVDPSWNPSVDDQSVDRCYRIGKDKNENVVVYRLVTIGTVDEKAYSLQILKGTTSRGFNDNKDIKRYFTDKGAQKQLMALPEKGFGESITKFEIEQNHGEEVHVEDDADLRLCCKKFGIVGLTNHGKLFSKKAKQVPDLYYGDASRFAFDPNAELFKQPVKCLVSSVDRHREEIEDIEEEMSSLKAAAAKLHFKTDQGAPREIQERFCELERRLKYLLSGTKSRR